MKGRRNMALTDADKKNFETIMAAADGLDLALVESRCTKTGEYRALVCAMQQNEDGTITPMPLAQMITGNPFEDYVDPTQDELPAAPP